ncbi:P-loop containing nucleoside triphosphate hydrolase protein [Trichoderma sp. SZMC 28015]
MSSSHVIESNTFGNDARIHQGDVIHNYARAPREPCVLIPFLRNEELIHRQDIISELDRILPLSDDYSTAALYGLGGSGKTQIALDYAYRRCQVPSCSVFWVHADNQTTFTQDFKSIAKRLGLSANLDGEDFLMSVRYGIESNPPWVIILDNADNLGLFGVNHTGQDALDQKEHAFSLERFIPRGPKGQVLWTSRDERIAGGLVAARRAIEIPKMTPSEAKELFESIRNNQEKNDDVKDVEELLEELEWLPLAISQAAAYMKKTLTSVEKYVLKLKDGKKRWRILKQSQSDRHRRRDVSNSVLETWNISMNYLQVENKTAYQILHIHAFLHNQNIPAELIKQAALYGDGSNDLDDETQSDDSSSDSDSEDDKITEAVARLCDFSFLSVQATEDGNRAYKMHKLVQEAMRYGLGRKERKKEESYLSLAALEIISSLLPAGPPEAWKGCEKFLTHAQQACEWATLCGREIMASDLLDNLTRHLLDRARFRESEITAQKTYELRKTILGDSHTSTIASMANVAKGYHLLGKQKEGGELLLKSLGLQQEILGSKHPDTLNNKALLARIYMETARFDEAEKLILEVLEVQRETLGNKHGITLANMTTLALAYSTLGKHEQAERTMLETLMLQREILGHNHPVTIMSSLTLGEIYCLSDKYAEAEGVTTETLILSRESLGHKSFAAFLGMGYLAKIFLKLGRGEEAEKLALETLTLEQEVLGDGNIATVVPMAVLGERYHTVGRYKEAEEKWVTVLEMLRKSSGGDNRHTIEVNGYLERTRRAMALEEHTEISS